MAEKTINMKADLGPQKNIGSMGYLSVDATEEPKPFTVERQPEYDVVIKDDLKFIPTSVTVTIGEEKA